MESPAEKKGWIIWPKNQKSKPCFSAGAPTKVHGFGFGHATCRAKWSGVKSDVKARNEIVSFRKILDEKVSENRGANK